MWRMGLLICHNCGEGRNTVGHIAGVVLSEAARISSEQFAEA